MKKTRFLILTGILIAAAVQAQVINLNDDNVSVTKHLRSTQNSVPHEFLKEAKAARFFAINPVLQNAKSVKINDKVALQLFEGKNYMAQVSNVTTDVTGTLALTLKFPDYPMGFAIITTSTEGKSLINISIPELGQTFGSRYDANAKSYYLIEVDESQRTPFVCGNDALEIPKGFEIFDDDDGNHDDHAAKHSHTHLRSIQADCGPTAKKNPETTATVRVLVLYTPAAAESEYVSSHGGIDNVISTMIALGNDCMTNSQTGITLVKAHSAEVNYVETGDMYTSLGHLKGTSDGYMDNIHVLRKQYNADLVQLLSIDNNSGGLGDLLRSEAGNFNQVFSVVWVTQVADTYPCSVHELGHNMGLGHGAQQTSVWADGIFDYSHGYRLTGTTNNASGNKYYTTVMSYPGNNYGDGLRSQYISYFSNPDVTYQTAATGTTSQIGPNNKSADAARSLRELKHVVAFYKEKLNTMPSTPIIIHISVTKTSATVTWENSGNNVNRYFLGQRLQSSSGSFSGALYYPPALSGTLSGLEANTTYQCTVLTDNDCGDALWSDYVTFTTLSDTDPTVTTLAATNVAETTATLNKTVTNNGTAITGEEFKYKKVSETNWQTSANGILTGLTENTQYQFYAYATTAAATFAGNLLTFTTSASGPIWTPQSSSTAWNNSTNWTPQSVPSATNRAIIPKSASYPVLTALTTVGEILFEPGAELGRQDLLTYNKAFVQLDFDAQSSRDRWWMLTNPLQELFVGDLSFGGLPGMDIKHYITDRDSEQGAWTSLSGYGHKFEAGEDFQIWLAPDPDHPEKTAKGLRHPYADGIITLPHFEDSGAADVHWTHDHDPDSHRSTFYGWIKDDGTNKYVRNTANLSVADRDMEKAYKLVTENAFTKDLDFGYGKNKIVYYAATGNPFMSSINFDKLQEDNGSIIGENYWVWVGPGVNAGGSYVIYNKSTGSLGSQENPLSSIVVPMQSFIVERKPESNATGITFNIANISATGQSSNAGLRASTQSNDLLEIIASTPQSAFRAAIASRENGSRILNGKDSRRFSAGINFLPDIYMLKTAANNSMVAVTANILNEIKEEITVPLAISTTYEGPVTLSFAGMDTYNARIFLIDTDAQNKKEYELTGQARYEYTFNYVPKKVNGTVVANENRFLIRLSPTNQTGIGLATPNNILIYNRQANTIQVVSGELIQHLSVFDLQGQKIYDNASVNAYEYTVTGLVPGVYVVKATGKQEVKTMKIIVK